MPKKGEFLSQSQIPSSLPAGIEFIYKFIVNSAKAKVAQSAVVAGFAETLREMAGEKGAEGLKDQIAAIAEINRQVHDDIANLNKLATALSNPEVVAFLSAAGASAATEPITELAMQAALTAYRKSVARKCLYADYRGIEGTTREEHVASFPLDDMYVMPSLRPERASSEALQRERNALEHLLDADLLPERKSALLQDYAKALEERWRPRQGTEEDSDEPLGRVLREGGRQLVIRGGPGVGKSVLLRYLSRSFALGVEAIETRFECREDAVPILLPLARYADARSGRASLTLREYLDGEMERQGGEPLRRAVAEEVAHGRTLVMLDGVDEIPQEGRVAVVQAVEDFIDGHETNRIIVTSRPYGYIRLQGDLPHYDLRNFSPGQVETFVRKWQRAFENQTAP